MLIGTLQTRHDVLEYAPELLLFGYCWPIKEVVTRERHFLRVSHHYNEVGARKCAAHASSNNGSIARNRIRTSELEAYP